MIDKEPQEKENVQQTPELGDHKNPSDKNVHMLDNLHPVVTQRDLANEFPWEEASRTSFQKQQNT